MKTKKIPSRLCVGCGEPKEKCNMIRVVKTADNEIRLDETGKLNGRGAYICKTAECLEKAVRSKGLERSLKTQMPPDILEALKEEMNAIETG